MDLMVCVGSSCHLKGSKDVIDKLNSLITEYDMGSKISLKGSFCMGACGNDGVSVKMSDTVYSLKLEDTNDFFIKEVLSRFK